jgi:hypothetical protein
MNRKKNKLRVVYFSWYQNSGTSSSFHFSLRYKTIKMSDQRANEGYIDILNLLGQ